MLTVTLALSMAALAGSQQITWTDFAQAPQVAQQGRKNILVYAYRFSNPSSLTKFPQTPKIILTSRQNWVFATLDLDRESKIKTSLRLGLTPHLIGCDSYGNPFFRAKGNAIPSVYAVVARTKAWVIRYRAQIAKDFKAASADRGDPKATVRALEKFVSDAKPGYPEVKQAKAMLDKLRRTAASAAPAKPAEPIVRVAAPTKEEIQKAEEMIRDLFKQAYARRGVADRLALAARLLEQAGAPSNDVSLPVRFVLFREGCLLAARAGDVKAAMAAADGLEKRFIADTVSLREEALGSARSAARTPVQARALAEAWMDLAQEALAADRYDTASTAVSRAASAARSARDAALAASAKELSGRVSALRKEFFSVRKHVATLKTDPDDPAANAAYGSFLCLVKGDWERGLPLLAKGSDGSLRDLAEQERAGPESPERSVALGDGWWDLASKEKKGSVRKGRMLGRAGYWYVEALPGLTGLKKLRTQQRLETTAKADGGSLPPSLARSLLLHYAFDRPVTDRVADRSGRGKHGRVSGASWLKNGRGGRSGAMGFDGADDYVSAGSLGPAPDRGTIMFWMQPAEVVNYRNPFTTKRHGSNVGFRFEENAEGNFGLVAGNDGGTFVGHSYTSASRLEAGVWYHVVAVWDRPANRVAGYLNGALVFDNSHQLWATSFDHVAFGTGFSPDTGRQWKGGLDELLIFNRALTKGEVAMVYRAQGGR